MNQLASAPPTNSWEDWHEDVEEIHRHREEIANRFDCDLDRMYEYYSSVPIDLKVRRADITPMDPKEPTKVKILVSPASHY